MPGEVIEQMRQLAGGALIDAGFMECALRHLHGQSAVASKVREIDLPMTGIINRDPRGDVIVPDHARVRVSRKPLYLAAISLRAAAAPV